MSTIPLATVTEDVLCSVIEELKRIERVSTLERHCARGRVILERCYGGSVKRWRSSNGRKTDSIRRMAAREDCPWKISSLHNSVHVFELCEREPWLRTNPALTSSHLIQVASLSNDEQAAFLLRAADENWSVSKLHAEVMKTKRERGERRGAPKAGAVRLALTELRRCERQLDAFENSVTDFPTASAETARAVSTAIDQLQVRLGEVRSRVLAWSRTGAMGRHDGGSAAPESSVRVVNEAFPHGSVRLPRGR